MVEKDEVKQIVRDELKEFLATDFPDKLAIALSNMPEIKFVVRLKWMVIGAIIVLGIVLPSTGIGKLITLIAGL